MISSEDITRLRKQTGAGVMASKKALEEAGGDFAKAKKNLASNAAVIAEEKAERTTRHGLIETYVHMSKVGVLLEILCESDFVARNAEFKNLAHHIAMQIASMKPKDLSELLAQNFIKDETITIKNLIEQATAKVGENIQIQRFVRYEIGE